MARAERSGPGGRLGIRRSLVGHRERALACRGAWPRPLVADRLEGSPLPHHGPRRWARVDARVQPRGRQAAVGGGEPRPDTRVASPEEQPRVGDADTDGAARLCVVRQQGRHGRRFRRPRGVAPIPRNLQQLSRHGRFAAALQEPADRLRGPCRRLAGGAFVAALDTATGKTVWQTSRRGTVGWSTPIAIRAFDHDEIIVSSQSRWSTPTTRIPAPNCGPAGATCSRSFRRQWSGTAWCSARRAAPARRSRSSRGAKGTSRTAISSGKVRAGLRSCRRLFSTATSCTS